MLTTTKSKADHEVSVDLHRAAVPDGMKVGETIHFSSSVGDVKIDFPGEWPFEGKKHSINSSEVLTIKKIGDYKFDCKLKRLGKKVYIKTYDGGEMKPR